MGAPVFSEFDTAQASIVADVKAAIDASSDWSNTSGQIMRCNAGGADMVVDLADAAASLNAMTLGVYRSPGVDKIQRFLLWKRTATGAATDPIHCQVSAGPDHLYIGAEGPRGGEPNAEDVTYGSYKTSLFLGTIVPYFDTTLDNQPAVVCVAATASGAANWITANVSRNAANSASWVPAYLMTLINPNFGSTNGILQGGLAGLDGLQYLGPWVVWEQTAGIRGRIKDCYYAGPSSASLMTASDPVRAIGQKLTYGGKTFVIVNPNRQHGVNVAVGTYLPWYASNVSANRAYHAVLIAVPTP